MHYAFGHMEEKDNEYGILQLTGGKSLDCPGHIGVCSLFTVENNPGDYVSLHSSEKQEPDGPVEFPQLPDSSLTFS